MAEGLSTTDQLSALQAAAREVKPDLGMPAEMGREVMAELLGREGYDLKNNSLEAATRAWQHRHGLSPKGFGEDGGPDAVTLALIAAKNNPEAAGSLDKAREIAMANLTAAANDRSNGSRLDTVFQQAGLGGALTAADAAPVAPAVAPTVAPAVAAHEAAHQAAAPAPSADPLGDFIRQHDKAVPEQAAPVAASGPSLNELGAAAGAKIGEGVDAVKDAGGRVWDSVSGAFKKLGEKAPEDPVAAAAAAERDAAAKAEREAQLKAAGAAITERAQELRQGAGDLATQAIEGVNNFGRLLKGKLDGLTTGAPGSAAPETSDPGVTPAVPAATEAKPVAAPQAKPARPRF